MVSMLKAKSLAAISKQSAVSGTAHCKPPAANPVKGYELKNVPEDFIVRERSTVIPGNDGKYSYFLMQKRDYNTLKAIGLIAKLSGSSPKDFGFAGTKDRRAVTSQVISFRGDSRRLRGINLAGISLEFLGMGTKPVSLGDLEGNDFEITVRKLEKAPAPAKKFINFFGEQRFSSQNADIGKAIINGDFGKACSLIGIPAEKNDYVGALRKISRKLLQMYVHAYQSWIWNSAVKEYLRACKARDNEKFPIPGFGSELEGCKGDIVRAIMGSEGITERSFIIRKLPEISPEGDERDIFSEAESLEMGILGDDELNPGKKKITLKFFLKKGSYATEFIAQLFQGQPQCP